MDIRDSVEIVSGMSVMVVTPALVEVVKGYGLPVRFAGGAAIVIALVLLAVAEIALDGLPRPDTLVETVARWLIAGIVYGMAAAGLYSQGHQLSRRNEHPA